MATKSIMGSSSMNRFPSPETPVAAGTFLAMKTPDLVTNSMAALCSARTNLKRKCTEASVAWPQRSAGHNYASPKVMETRSIA